MTVMTSLWQTTRGAAPQTDGPEALDAATAYDVAVVGAGLTGLVTAHLLAATGRSVVVLEARSVGAVTTGNTTAKVSLLQGSVMSEIKRYAGAGVLPDYAAANRAGQEWLIDHLGEGGVLQRRDAYTYAVTERGRSKVLAELEACRDAGLPVELLEGQDLGLPFPTDSALRLADQAQIHPLRVLNRLTAEVRQHGGVVVEGVRVTGMSAGEPHDLETTAGPVRAAYVVLATGTPILDRGLHFARLLPQRSYALAYRWTGEVPQGMYLSVDAKSRSVRSAPIDGQDYLLVGGNGHTVGRHDSTVRQVEDLDRWAHTEFPGVEQVGTWSAQDYRTGDRMPYVGPLLPGQDRVLVATGYHKWGMANAVAAALAIRGRIDGTPPPWAGALASRGLGVARGLELAKLNAEVGALLGLGWVRSELRSAPEEVAEGQGVTGREGPLPVATSRVGGEQRTVSAVCTHLRGIVRWNEAECSWDCPLHGSRFAADGSVLEGPATRPLAPREPAGH